MHKVYSNFQKYMVNKNVIDKYMTLKIKKFKYEDPERIRSLDRSLNSKFNKFLGILKEDLREYFFESTDVVFKYSVLKRYLPDNTLETLDKHLNDELDDIMVVTCDY